MFRKNIKNLFCLGTFALSLGGASFAQTFMGIDGEDLFRTTDVGYGYDSMTVSSPALSIENVDSLFSVQAQETVDSERVRKLYELLSEKTTEARGRRNYGLSLSSRIREIENLKKDLANLLQDGYNSGSSLDDMMRAEIQERISRPARAAELNADGSLNARGQARLNNDIEAIKDKYKNMRSTQTNPETMRQANLLKNQVSTKIRDLESANLVESSLQNSGVELFFGSFSNFGDEEGWPYTVVYTIEGNEIFRDVGVITYKELTGKSIPSVPAISSPNYAVDSKDYENFLDNVEVFNKAFDTDVDFMEAVVSFKVQQGSSPSSYRISVGNVSIKNIVTSSLVKSFSENKSGIYQCQPKIDVDLTIPQSYYSGSLSNQRTNENQNISLESGEQKNSGVNIAVNVEFNTPKVEEKQEQSTKKSGDNKKEDNKKTDEREKKYPQSNWWNSVWGYNKDAKISGGKNAYGSLLYFLPGNVCAYVSESDFGLSLGYSLNLGLTRNFFIGLNAESGFFGPILLFDCYGGDSYYYDDTGIDDFGVFVFTGQVGANFSVGSWMRMSVYAEAGLLFNDFAAGLGASIELSAPKSSTAFNMGVTDFVTLDGKNVFKTYIGMEILW